MDLLDALIHLLNFVAPAMVVGWSLAALAPLLMRTQRPPRGWLRQGALNSLAGTCALGAGLWFFDNDGKMASYAALVAVVATSQWLGSRAWKR